MEKTQTEECLLYVKAGDETRFGGNLTTTPFITCCNPIGQGFGYNGRIGNRVIQTKLDVLVAIVGQGVNILLEQEVRILIVYDKQSQGTAPVITDILSSTDVQAFFNYNNRDRFIFLYDKYIIMGLQQNTSGQAYSTEPSTYCERLSIPLDLEALFAPGVATPVTGAIWVCAWSTNTLTQGYRALFSTRTYFYP